MVIQRWLDIHLLKSLPAWIIIYSLNNVQYNLLYADLVQYMIQPFTTHYSIPIITMKFCHDMKWELRSLKF